MHTQTKARLNGAVTAYGFRVHANPSADDPTGCTIFGAVLSGPTWQGSTTARIRDLCINPGPGSPPVAEGTVTVQDGPDGSSVLSMHFAIGSAPPIAMCAALVQPQGNIRYVSGGSTFLMAPVIDNTRRGSDHRITPPRRRCAKAASAD